MSWEDLRLWQAHGSLKTTHASTPFISEMLAKLKEALTPQGATFFLRKTVNTGKTAVCKLREISYELNSCSSGVIFIDINILYPKVIKSTISQMRSGDTDDGVCV
jgi:hypothetical protein